MLPKSLSSTSCCALPMLSKNAYTVEVREATVSQCWSSMIQYWKRLDRYNHVSVAERLTAFCREQFRDYIALEFRWTKKNSTDAAVLDSRGPGRQQGQAQVPLVPLT